MVVVTHGQLATELVNAAAAIVGDLPRFAAVSLHPAVLRLIRQVLEAAGSLNVLVALCGEMAAD